MSDLIVLDYSDAVVHVFHDVDGFGDAERFLYEQHDFKESEIEWMSGEDIKFVHHGEGEQEAVFRIDTEEVRASTDTVITDADMRKILSFIENDEGIWEAIEQAKRDAISSVLGN